MANLNFNKVILCGRLTKDPELKTTTGGKSVTSFSIAVNRPKSGDVQQTDFLNIVCFQKEAETVYKYFHKGDSILIEGSIQTNSWITRNGEKRYSTDIRADRIYFVDSKAEKHSAASVSLSVESPQFEEVAPDGELPF